MSRGPSWALLTLTLLAGCGGDPTGEPVEVTVPTGAGLGEVADSLTSRGIVDYGLLFQAYVRLKRADRGVRAGTYRLRPGEAWSRIVETLTEGRVVTSTMTIPEGWTLRQMAPRIAQITRLPADTVLRRLTADTASERWEVPGPGLEGYLFPDTYRFAPGTSLDRVVATMTDRYRAYWTEERRARLDSLGMSEREAVTLASIVQAEARRLEEMPAIAGVYHNRLERRMLLGADPTVLYALGGYRARLLYAAIDSVADNPYNTYTQRGLPPGPIGAPGERALDATLEPAETDDLYFVALPDGRHLFTGSLAEHNRARVAARRAWDTARATVGVRGPVDAGDSVADPVEADTAAGPPPPNP
ncbi:MAG: endolytic transglycosylase MltG [Gemmatimonadetes bacterium]|nr:endolytic transglycosylase MltG [Gemmatimonadota bacterium]